MIVYYIPQLQWLTREAAPAGWYEDCNEGIEHDSRDEKFHPDGFPSDLGELWETREVPNYLTQRDIKIRYKQTALDSLRYSAAAGGDGSLQFCLWTPGKMRFEVSPTRSS